jgi:hypothetical protein
MSIDFQRTTRLCIPEDNTFHDNLYENLKSCNILMFSNAVKGHHYSTQTHMFWSMECYNGNNIFKVWYPLISHFTVRRTFYRSTLTTVPMCFSLLYKNLLLCGKLHGTEFFFEKVTVILLAKVFPTLYELQVFITVVTKTCNLTLFWARLIHSTPHSISLTSLGELSPWETANWAAKQELPCIL